MLQKTKSKLVATKLTIEEMAKLRDAVIIKGVHPGDIPSCSKILKAAIILTILSTNDPLEEPTIESMTEIKKLWKVVNLNNSNINI